MEETIIKKVEKIVPEVVDLFLEHLWMDYDKSADVLYVSFEKPQHADESEIFENDTIVHTRKKKIVGVTVLNASKFGIA